MSGTSSAADARCASPVVRIIVTQRSCPQITAGRNAALPKLWSLWPWVLTTIPTRGEPSSPRSSRISRACTKVDRVSTISAAPPPSTAVMSWS